MRVNDMKSASTCHLFLYADDYALLVSHNHKNEVENTLRSELLNVNRWLGDHESSLHLGKTEPVLFGSLSSRTALNAICFFANM